MKLRVGVNGYGVIGRRVADAVALQADMTLSGVADTAIDWRTRLAQRRGYATFGATEGASDDMAAAGLAPAGTLTELLDQSDVIIDCTPKGVDALNLPKYREIGVCAVFQGGASHSLTGHSFVASANYHTAVGRQFTRVVSCNTTATVRTLGALRRAELLVRARGVLIRRATDPWESHLGGIMNTMVPEPDIPSHQGPDAKTVIPDLDVITMASKSPQTVAHLHHWMVELTRPASREEVLAALRAEPRIAMIRVADGLGALNVTAEVMKEIGRPRGDMWEVAVWEDMLTVEGRELFYAYQVDNQAIVIPETIDSIRALTARELDPAVSIRQTNVALGVRQEFL